jgi:predicted Zn finger-like uncharacterized protein
MEIVCQDCKTSHYLSDDKIPLETKVGKCKKCNAAITVLGKNDFGSIIGGNNLVTITEARTDLLPVEQEETKRCDFCGEKVLSIAKKCKHCGETLDIILRTAEEARRASNSPNVFMNSGGAAAAAAAVVSSPITKHNFPHGWHLFGAIITVGWWTIIWILHYLFRDKNYYC